MEIWKDIYGYYGYQVSNEGRVRSFVNNRHGACNNFHILKPVRNHGGYPTVCLGRGKRKLVSRLVAEAFIPNPRNLPLVRHMDDNPLNNNISGQELKNLLIPYADNQLIIIRIKLIHLIHVIKTINLKVNK